MAARALETHWRDLGERGFAGMISRRLLGRLLAGALVVAALAFVALAIVRDADALRSFDWDVDPLLLIASVAAHVLLLAWGVVVLHRVLLQTTDKPVTLGAMLRLWFLSAVARYIPGKIWQFVAAAQLASRAGTSGPAVVTAMAIHIGFTLLAAGLVAVATLPLPVGGPWGRGALVVLATFAALAVSHPAVLRFGLGILPRALHRDVVAWRGRWVESFVLLTLCVISWVAGGLIFHLFVAALVDTTLAHTIPFIGINAISFVAGYAAVFAPAGLGVREWALTSLLGPFMPAYIAATIALLSRLWIIAAELLGAGFALAWRAGTRSAAGHVGARDPGS